MKTKIKETAGTVKTKIKEAAGEVKTTIKDAADMVKNNAVPIKNKIIETTGVVKKKAADALLTAAEIKNNIKLTTRALGVILANKEIRNEITNIVKGLADVSKKSIEEARDDIVKDKVFLKNLTDTSNKIGDQVSTAVYSTVNGASLGVLSDVRAAYSGYAATLNSIDLLSSIVKIPIIKLEEQLKSDSKEIVSLIKSVISVKNEYDSTVKKINDEINDNMKLAQASLSVPALPVPALPVPALPVPALRVPALRVPVPALRDAIRSVGGSSSKKKKKRTTLKRIRNRNRNRKRKSRRIKKR